MKTHKVPLLILVLLIIGNAVYLSFAYKQTVSDDALANDPVLQTRLDSTVETVSSMAQSSVPEEAFTGGPTTDKSVVFASFFREVQTQNIFRIKIWNRDYQILWSNASEDIGKVFRDNHEVEEALEGEVEKEIETHDTKGEHQSEQQYSNFAEVYVPIKNDAGEIIGVVETYQSINDIVTSNKETFAKRAYLSVGISALIAAGVFALPSIRKKLRRSS